MAERWTPEEILADLDKQLATVAEPAAALIRKLQAKPALWEAMAARDMRNGVSREGETIHDRDARAAMQALVIANPDSDADRFGFAHDALDWADAMAAERARRAKESDDGRL